jgi:hypothetical protein
MSLSKFPNNKTRLDLSRGDKRPLKMKTLSMQEGLTSRKALDIGWETNTTQG